MSLSLIGIIFVQAYFISDSVKNEQEQFTFKVKKALSYTSKAIQDNEYREYVRELQKYLAAGGTADSTSIIELTFYKPDENSNELIIYRNGILEENFMRDFQKLFRVIIFGGIIFVKDVEQFFEG